jgi:hypothetical protein
MGSFNATCIVSNLPVEAGTPVRYVLLTRSRFHPDGNDHICYVSGRWQLRGPAIKAKYNDYGSIESIEESFATREMFDALNRDAVEKGVGDNQCHDVQVRAGMSRAAWLDALWEGRVFVLDEHPVPAPEGGWKREEPKEGMPSLARLESVLRAADLPVVTAYGANGYVLDEVSSGFIRIRCGRSAEFGKKEEVLLEKALPYLHAAGYATMITCGTGAYANHAEILVAPKPAPEGVHFFVRGGIGEKVSDLERPKPRPVSQAMIREDVWQIMLGMVIDGWRGKFAFEDMKAAALLALKDIREAQVKAAELRASGDSEKLFEAAMLLLDVMDDTRARRNPFLSALRDCEGVSGQSLGGAFRDALNSTKTDEELEAFTLSLAETAFVESVYAHLHGQWHPTTNGSQDGNWKAHRAFLRQLALIQGKYDGDDDDDYDGDNGDDTVYLGDDGNDT